MTGAGVHAARSANAAAKAGSDAWRVDKLWDDGKAEFCVYEVDWARYGHVYPVVRC
jgi:hypothetical protein